jgi:branched-subunit amino acid aminotransferase/4-amino-4-deoxychorismate lyase
VLWLDAIERRYLEEVGTMNLFVVIGDGATRRWPARSCPASPA